jgi:hypothetical protein
MASVSALKSFNPLLQNIPSKLQTKNEQPKPQDWNTAQSMQDIGRKLLQSIGFSAPDDASIQASIEANDEFIARLEAIRDQAQGTISAA